MMGRKLLCLIILCIQLEKFRSFGNNVCKNEARCTISRSHGMRSVDCYHKDFSTFPKCIPSDTEVLDLSFNRIRKVNKSDLSKFSNLKYLYLNENFFGNIPNDTFQGLDYLISIDLSLNNLKMIPPSLFNLPSLNILSFRQNFELNIPASVNHLRPIASPISAIDMSSITDKDSMTEFPDFGPMPHLLFLNISENWFNLLAPKHFAGLCKLEKLISVNILSSFSDDCDCWVINKWLTERHVQFKPFLCPNAENECPNREVSEEGMSVYNHCLQMAQAIEQKLLTTKIYIGLGVSSLILIITLSFVYFCFIRRKKSKSNNVKSVPSEGPLLLNNHLNKKL